MRELLNSLIRNLKLFSTTGRPYKELRKHLDRQAVGYPATLSGVELRLLKEIFTTDEARAALHLRYRFEPFETIYARSAETGYDRHTLTQLLESMYKKGSIILRHDSGETRYALHPLVLGMYETNIKRLTPGLSMDMRRYVLEGFGMEYLTTHVPQMRVIPINKSLPSANNVATYDDIRELVARTKAGICVTDCICKVSKDLIGQPCKITDRRELCLYFMEYAEAYACHGWGRSISKKEAMEILDQNEKDGLVLMTACMQEPHVICSCCDCCCGVIEMIKIMQRPVDFVASNYLVEIDPESCNGCHLCVERCQMEAVLFDEKQQKAMGIDAMRCIGCGLCVPTCKSGSIRLKKKDRDFVPPKDYDELYDTIMQNKKGFFGKVRKIASAIAGREV